MQILSRLIPVAASSFAVQLGFASLFVPLAEERLFDLSGTAGFLVTTLVSIYPHARVQSSGILQLLTSLYDLRANLAPRQLLLTAALVVWTGRLGIFLAQRAIKAGGDSRFDRFKHDKFKFTVAWVVQAAWVLVVGLPVYLSNLVPASAHPPLGVRDYAALSFAAASFLLEVAADYQKSTWRHARNVGKHDEKFISSGLWAWSRHPNYVGEVGIWTGIWGIAALSKSLPWQAVLLSTASPIGSYLFVRYATGIPPLERVGNKKFRDDAKWKAYKRTVPVFFPWGGYE